MPRITGPGMVTRDREYPHCRRLGRCEMLDPLIVQEAGPGHGLNRRDAEHCLDVFRIEHHGSIEKYACLSDVFRRPALVE